MKRSSLFCARVFSFFRIAVLLPLLAVAVVRAALTPEPLTTNELSQGYRDTSIIALPHANRLAEADAAEPAEGRRMLRKFSHFRDMRVLAPAAGETAAAAITRLRATGRYEFVEPDYLRYATATPNDPAFSTQWSLSNTGQAAGTAGADIGALAAWNTRTDASSVIVAIIDTGINLTHTDLAGNFWSSSTGSHGIDSTVATTSASYFTPTDTDGHGSHVAGIIGAVGNNSTGTTGIAWTAKLMALKFLTATGGSVSNSIACIQYAIANGAKVINASYGSSTYSQAEFNAIKAARDAGIVFVAAASNDTLNNDLNPEYPSNYALDNIVSVAATDRTDAIASYSDFGASVEIAAPGSSILSTYIGSTTATATLSGTSMAAPHVTGAIALLRAQYPTDTYRQSINRLLRGATKLPALTNKIQTGARLNLADALTTTSNLPFNDNFADAPAYTAANLRVRASNNGATAESGEPAPAGITSATSSLWWSWTASESTQVSFDTLGSDYDTVLAIYTGSALSALTPVASNDDSSAGVTTSRIVLNVTAGTTYRITVAGKAGATGYTALKIGSVPANDNFAAAKALTGNSIRLAANNLNATREASEPNPSGKSAGHSLWYSWVAPASGTYNLSAYALALDTIAAVYTGSSVSSLTTVAYNDNSRTLSALSYNSDALVKFTAVAGTTYYLQIDNSTADGLDGGDLVLTLTDSAWEFPGLDEVTASPAVDSDGTVYFGTGSTNSSSGTAYEGAVYAVNPDGTLKWSYTTTTTGYGIIGGSPAVSPSGVVYIGSYDGVLYALNASTGARKWSYTAGSALSSAPAIGADGTVYFRDNIKLYALTDNGGSSTLKWAYALNSTTVGGTYGSPVIGSDGTIYVGTTGGTLLAITDNGTSAVQKWSYTADGDIYTSPALAADGTLYFATLADSTNSTGGSVYAVSSAGAKLWSWTAPAHSSITSSIALDTTGNLYFAAYDHKLYALTGAGVQKWAYTLGDEVRASSPTLASDGTIYIGCYDSLVYAINADGTLKRTYPTAKTIRSSPVIAGNRLYIGSADAKLHAFDLNATPQVSAWPTFHANARRTGRAVTDALAIGTQPFATTAAVGSAATLSVAATGTGPFAYQWFKNGVAIPGATTANYLIASVTAADAAVYSVRITNASSTTTSTAALLTVNAAPTGLTGRLSNLSVLTTLSANQVLTVGFTMSGGSKPVLLRAAGPGLSAFGITGFMTDPKLALFNGTTQIATNDNWAGNADVAAANVALGAFPFASTTSLDAALVTAIDGGRTMQVSGPAAGTVIVEAYDAGSGNTPRLTNLSALNFVSSSNLLIAGFTIAGTGTKTVLIRAIGPGLTPLGVGGALADPKLELYNSAQVKIAENDTWAAALASTFTSVGAFALPANSKDAALVVTLAPGGYTVQVSGVAGTTGQAIVEVYELP